jgi:hypothetical protein
MDATLVAEIETLRRTAVRLEQAGLIIDPATLSPARRRAYFALQCRLADGSARPVRTRAPMGFPYANERGPDREGAAQP